MVFLIPLKPQNLWNKVGVVTPLHLLIFRLKGSNRKEKRKDGIIMQYLSERIWMYGG